MNLSRNSNTIFNVCLVQIKSIHGISNILDFDTIYSTPSKITFRSTSQTRDSGLIHNNTLTVSYPGLKPEDFDNFSKLTLDQFQVLIKLDNNDIYQVASVFQPMDCRVSFSNNHSVTFFNQSYLSIKYRDNQPDDGINLEGFNYDLNFFLN